MTVLFPPLTAIVPKSKANGSPEVAFDEFVVVNFHEYPEAVFLIDVSG